MMDHLCFAELPNVKSTLHFLERNPIYDREKPYSILYEPHGDVPATNILPEAVEEIPIHDIRSVKDKLEFDRDGFVITPSATTMKYEDFSEPDKVIDVYLQEVQQLLSKLLHTKNVAVLEYLIRRRAATFPISGGEDFDFAQPVATAHIDFTPNCIEALIRERYKDNYEDLLECRWQMVNVWKPLVGFVQDWPLAVCHPESVDAKNDLQAMDRVYARSVEESIQIHYAAHQRWCFLGNQQENEALVFRGADSKFGFPAGVPHCSFPLPQGAELGKARESVEVRALVFHTDKELDLGKTSVLQMHGPKSRVTQD